MDSKINMITNIIKGTVIEGARRIAINTGTANVKATNLKGKLGGSLLLMTRL